MRGLANVHRRSKYYHPLTMMCYRKRLDGRFEFCKTKRLILKDQWKISGIRTGFLLIKDYKKSKH